MESTTVNQPLAGVSPSSLSETTIMVVWPSIGATSLGRFIGSMCLVGAGRGRFMTLGKILAPLMIPLALALYFVRLAPPYPTKRLYNRRYRLTNRRVIEIADRLVSLVPWNLQAETVEIKSVNLDQFDSIDIQVLSGQAWYPAGELIFRKGNVETFRLSGVQRPAPFKATCLKAHVSYVGVQQAIARQGTV